MKIGKFWYVVISLVIGMLLAVGVILPLNASEADITASDFFVTPSGGGDCSQSSPCALQTAMSVVTDGATIYVAEGLYTHTNRAVISITKSITLYGGWDGAPSGPVIRDPDMYPATLDGEQQRRVVYVNEEIMPTIDGFIISNGNANGLGGGHFEGSDAGGGIYSLNASPIIRNNIITNNLASTQSGIRALGGGVYIRSDTTPAMIYGNRFFSNTAGIDIHQGDGGGLFIYGPGDILSNTFRDNVGCVNCARPFGGGIQVGWTTHEIRVTHNLFEHNRARSGGGIYLVWSAVEVNNNTIVSNTATLGGGALHSHYDKGSRIHANVIMSNSAASFGGGVAIQITTGPEPTCLFNNIIVQNQAGDSGAAVYAYSDWHLSIITMTHNTLADNGMGIAVSSNMTATLINNIVVSHTLAVTTTDPSANIFADHNLFWGNDEDGMLGTNPVESEPAFVNPGMGDYHITPDSGAIDSGVDAGVLTDMDGDPRPSGDGYDLGADEVVGDYKLYLPCCLRGFGLSSF